MRSIAIIGFMAVGKTSVAKLLAYKLGRTFMDMDAEIVEEQEQSIAEIFTHAGEAYFRALEHDKLLHISEMDNVVLSTGGGIVISDKNRALLKEKFFLITLTSTPEIILKRVKQDGNGRPLLADNVDVYDTICQLQKKREAFYRHGDIIIDTSDQTVVEIVDNILKQMRILGEIE